MSELTPMMHQYREIKSQYPEALLFFRLGDFYEMFFEDAVTGARELDIVLTSREAGENQRVPMCGIPYHAADTYIARLLARGYRVAVCEQVEDPKKAKGLVRREVVRVITPGTTTDPAALPEKEDNYLVAVAAATAYFGLAVADISTGEFRVTQIPRGEEEVLLDHLASLRPAECLLPPAWGEESEFHARIANATGVRPLTLSAAAFGSQLARRRLAEQFGDALLPGPAAPEEEAALQAAGALLEYLAGTQKAPLAHLHPPVPYRLGARMYLDLPTVRQLEIVRSWPEGKVGASLYGVLDFTCTPMGGRLLRRWLLEPLTEVTAIQERLDAVEEFTNDLILRENLQQQLRHIHDMERLVGRAACGTAHARDLLALKESLQVVPGLATLVADALEATALHRLLDGADLATDITDLLEQAIDPEAPLALHEGGLIRRGYHPEVDRWRQARDHGQEWITTLEAAERERTGIKSLKVGFNKVFGYYIEVTRPNLELVPPDYVRRQTLAAAERFVTPQLKEYEELIMQAEENLADLEYDLFLKVRQQVVQAAPRLQELARRVAKLDALASLAEAAARYNYVRPAVDTGTVIEIRGGRHPVVERCQEDFVPNDVYLDTEDHRLTILTGPNMAGKSTFLRQVALITLMAQVGSFVPARKAVIGIVDRIFTRAGAADDLAAGRSTFLVEMQECRAIVTQATSRSLVVMDEVGRGTSTYDGLSLAQAIAEYLHDAVGARTIFSTHYHELTTLAEKLPGAQNYHTAVKEEGGRLVFLHLVRPGKADKSYGIQVAALAALPEKIITRAAEIMASLEAAVTVKEAASTGEPEQPALFAVAPVPDDITRQIMELDLVSMTPLDALNELYRLQTELRNGGGITGHPGTRRGYYPKNRRRRGG